ncbi:UNVERIFIED_CONTAM: hypothetical protein GTU68_019812 [Idotea baltica]|nr:hypothetical protein [Idotea baltica]
MNKEAKNVWDNCLDFVKQTIKPQAYKTWFEPVKPVKLSGDTLTIQVPSKFFYEWIEDHYIKLLRVSLVRQLGNDAKLIYDVKMENNYSSNRPQIVKIPSSNRSPLKPQKITAPQNSRKRELRNPFVIAGLQKVKIESQLNPNYSFINFSEGDSNRLARSAGMAVANKPGGTSFNPLLIYGSVGLGKTHLAHAIGVDIKDKYPDKTVLYISSEKFAQEFIDSVKSNTRNDFIHFYQMIDVLIIDDIQYLSGKAGTQDVFFHIFNHLHQNGKQVILTSDKSPDNMQDIEQRLLSRFQWGLSAELLEPDYETRISILQNKLYRDGVEMNDDIVEHIAKNIKSNIRKLEGILISMIAEASFNRKDFSLELADELILKFRNNSNEGKKVYRHIIEISDLLKSAFIKYLISFDDYVKDTKGIELEFHTKKHSKGIELEVLLENQINIENISKYLDEYVSLIKQTKPNVKNNIEINKLTRDIELLEIKYENQISQFKFEIKLANYKIDLLESHLDFFKGISFAKHKEPVVLNLNLNQNQSLIQPQTNFLDIQELKQIYDFFETIKDSTTDNELKKDISKIKDELSLIDNKNIDDVKKKEFKSIFSKFFSKLKSGVDKITWTSKALDSFIKGKEALNKLADSLGIDIKDVLDQISN